MNNKSGALAVVLSVIAITLSVVSLVTSTRSSGVSDVQYVMYIGTNDKDTNEPVATPDEAKKLVEDILVEHFGGYTIQEANGGWKNEGTRYQEYSPPLECRDAACRVKKMKS